MGQASESEMGGGEKLRCATDYFHPFPNAEDVFANRVQEHSEYLLPLATISLNRVLPDLTGNLHVVMPIEPAGGWGCVGDRSAPYHNYLCRPNWIGYRVIDGKLELACDFQYFHKAFSQEHAPQDQHAKWEAEALGAHYKEIRAEFECRRRYFREHGSLIWSTRPYREGEPVEVDAPWIAENGLPLPLVSDLGGQSFQTNWAATDFPLSIRPQPRDMEKEGILASIYKHLGNTYEISPGLPIAVPKTEDGRDFIYVGCAEMGTFAGDMDGGMLLFYDPRNQLALTTFDWS